MSWRTAYYGNESPSRRRKLSINAFWTGFALAVYGGWGDFVPSREWAWVALVVSILAALVTGAMLIGAVVAAERRLKGKVSVWKTGIALLGFPFLLFGLYWLALGQGLPNLVTWVIGAPGSITTIAAPERISSRRGCDFRVDGPALKRKFPSYVCISESMYRALPKVAKVTFEGRTTPLGFRIERVSVP